MYGHNLSKEQRDGHNGLSFYLFVLACGGFDSRNLSEVTISRLLLAPLYSVQSNKTKAFPAFCPRIAFSCVPLLLIVACYNNSLFICVQAMFDVNISKVYRIFIIITIFII